MSDAQNRVTLVSVDEPQSTDTGRIYVLARFKQGILGRPVTRSFWGTLTADGDVSWDRASYEELLSLRQEDVTGQAFIEPVDIEPKEIVNSHDGSSRTITSAVIVRFADETLTTACQRYGMTLRQDNIEQKGDGVPNGFRVVGVNGQIAPASI